MLASVRRSRYAEAETGGCVAQIAAALEASLSRWTRSDGAPVDGGATYRVCGVMLRCCARCAGLSWCLGIGSRRRWARATTGWGWLSAILWLLRPRPSGRGGLWRVGWRYLTVGGRPERSPGVWVSVEAAGCARRWECGEVCADAVCRLARTVGGVEPRVAGFRV
jgi:hypothetical protein